MDDVQTNTIEGAWSLFNNRGVVGAFHHVYAEPLHRYFDEFEFRSNNRNNAFIFRAPLRELVASDPLGYKSLIENSSQSEGRNDTDKSES